MKVLITKFNFGLPFGFKVNLTFCLSDSLISMLSIFIQFLTSVITAQSFSIDTSIERASIYREALFDKNCPRTVVVEGMVELILELNKGGC